MSSTQEWRSSRDRWSCLLEQRTGMDVDRWQRRIASAGLGDEPSLRAWLVGQGVTGYPQALLVKERFCPEFSLASARELIELQYADRPALRPVLDAVIEGAQRIGTVTVQARKSYVSLESSGRAFARARSATRWRIDLCLRLESQRPTTRLRRSRLFEPMRLQIGLGAVQDVDAEVIAWLRRAYEENERG